MGLLKHTINCLVCGEKKETNHSGTKYCSQACRQSMYRNGVTKDKIKLRNEVNGLRNAYADLVRSVAQKLGKDNKWIDKKIELHAKLLLDDAHHGYTETEGIFELKERYGK